jgi:hypothetical protein
MGGHNNPIGGHGEKSLNYLSFTTAKTQHLPTFRRVSRGVRERGLGYVPKIRIERIRGWHAVDGVVTGSGLG